MTIFIYCEKETEKDATNIISKPDDLKRQIVRAWHQSNIKHCFSSKSGFNKAVHRNWKTLKLKSRDKIDMLFTSSNYLFSTWTEGRKETLYFEDLATKKTGRLRQQHPKGPLAKIDQKTRTRRFLSKRRFERVKEWHDKHKHRLPRFYFSEERAKNGKHHIEFSCEKKRVSAWHSSAGTIKTSKHDLDRRISSALQNILGIHSKKSSVIAKH